MVFQKDFCSTARSGRRYSGVSWRAPAARQAARRSGHGDSSNIVPTRHDTLISCCVYVVLVTLYELASTLQYYCTYFSLDIDYTHVLRTTGTDNSTDSRAGVRRIDSSA
jgi:hypothetical protein